MQTIFHENKNYRRHYAFRRFLRNKILLLPPCKPNTPSKRRGSGRNYCLLVGVISYMGAAAKCALRCSGCICCARMQAAKPLPEKVPQGCKSKNSVGKSSCRLHGVKPLPGKVPQACRSKNFYREMLRKGAGRKNSTRKSSARVQQQKHPEGRVAQACRE